MKVVDAATMRAMDERAMTEFAMKNLQLMENAGRAVADVVLGELRRRKAAPARVAIICGKGNNGGDGFVCARHLANAGVEVSLFVLAPQGAYRGDSRVNLRTWLKMGGRATLIKSGADLEKNSAALQHAHVVVDALLGTGITGGARGLYAEVIEYINGLWGAVVAVDVPSGLDATTGKAEGPVVRADVTVTMALPKTGFFLPPGASFVGRLEVGDIGMPGALLADSALRHNLITEDLVRPLVRPRPGGAHKGTFGHVAVLGGSTGKTGAPCMAALGAMRAGAGLVTMGLPAGLRAVMETKAMEIMTCPLEDGGGGLITGAALDGVLGLLEGKSALVAGPGLGVSEGAEEVMSGLVKKAGLPMVIDADGLNNIAKDPGIMKEAASGEVVLTPHPGEAARLLGVAAKDIQADRIGSATRISEVTGAVVVLKGANTIVAALGKEIFINTTGGPALASAGTGDVLSGVIGGLLAQGMNAPDAALTAVHVHGLAGDRVSRTLGGQRGLLATDLLSEIPRVLNSVASGKGCCSCGTGGEGVRQRRRMRRGRRGRGR